ncbi:hypothetical protein T11_13172 [Trichinella zimbabwensis]|uniref:Uncharacterized protein n=1 Tax=Trichinella zimbabwensis TaxID=268475 RepID=A0A0V1HN22_9BILA|nr:hypothetical protein T11_13172 [Trichinella zimbabwensis]
MDIFMNCVPFYNDADKKVEKNKLSKISSPRKLDIRSASKTLLTYSASSKDAALFRLFCLDLTDRTSAFGKSNVDNGLLRACNVFCNVN